MVPATHFTVSELGRHFVLQSESHLENRILLLLVQMAWPLLNISAH